jgi:hypothetical protein
MTMTIPILTSSWSMTDKEMNTAAEGRFQIFSGLKLFFIMVAAMALVKPLTHAPAFLPLPAQRSSRP